MPATGTHFGTGNQAAMFAALPEARFLMADGREGRCRIGSLAASGAILHTGERAEKGSRIIIYVQGLGRVEAAATGHSPAGLHIAFPEKDTNTRARITTFIRPVSDAESRRAARVKLNDAHSVLWAGQESATCEVLDISLTGALLRTKLRTAPGTFVTIGKMRARVVRLTADGLAIEFVTDTQA